VRYAARIGLESQPVAAWRERALTEKDATGGLTALLALARLGGKEDQVPLLKALAKWPLDSLNENLFLLKLRVIEVGFARHGIPDEIRPLALDKLGRQYPAASWPKNRELSQLLVALEAPDAVTKTLTLRDSAATQEEQLHYMTVLRKARSGWSMSDRKRYFAWFNERNHNHPTEFVKWFNDVGLQPQDGASLANFLKNLRTEAASALTDAERTELAGVIAGTEPVAAARPARPRDVVQAWTSGDLAPLLDKAGRGRNFEHGRQAFADAQCLACHRFAGEGGAIGPDLNGLSSRFTRADILKSILEPSAVVSEQYQNVTLTLKGGDDVTGRVLEEKGDQVTVLTDPLQNSRQQVRKADIQNRFASKLSPMPEGLLNVLTKDEVLDLIAYLESGGRKEAGAFGK
jgi:putative heme-binding domain-containing protein